jgi:GNAT superfamily N-acetyltransferase
MKSITPSLAHRLELAYAQRAALYAHARQALHQELESRTEPYGGGSLVYAGPGAPVNRAIGLGFVGLFNETDLARVERFYSIRGAAPRLDLCPLAHPSLLEMLQASRYRLEGFYSVLARPLRRSAPPAASPGVRVALARPEDADLWLRTVAEGFSGQDPPPAEAIDLIAPTFYSETARCFLAYVEGRPAGGGALIAHQGVAELCSASTRPAWRRRGVQRALLAARLADARQLGCEWAMSVTAPGGASQRNLERAGFHLAYTKAVLSAAGPG